MTYFTNINTIYTGTFKENNYRYIPQNIEYYKSHLCSQLLVASILENVKQQIKTAVQLNNYTHS